LAILEFEEVLAGGYLLQFTGIRRFRKLGIQSLNIENQEALSSYAPLEMKPYDEYALHDANNSPFFGKEGKFVTFPSLESRLMEELRKTLQLRVETNRF